MIRILLPLAFLSLLFCAACIDITHVQTGYVSDRDQCRGRAENGVGVYSDQDASPLNDKDKNSALMLLFCQCMKEYGWNTAGCPKPAPPAAPVVAAAKPTVIVVAAPTPSAGTPPPVVQAAPCVPVTGHKKRKHPPKNACAAPDYSSTPNPTPAQSDSQLGNIIEKQ